MLASPLGRTWQIRVPFQGALFFWDGYPTALPWAASELPLAGRKILRQPVHVF